MQKLKNKNQASNRHTFKVLGRLYNVQRWCSKNEGKKTKNHVSIFLVDTSPSRGREPQDALSLHYADMSLPDLLGRPSLRYAGI